MSVIVSHSFARVGVVLLEAIVTVDSVTTCLSNVTSDQPVFVTTEGATYPVERSAYDTEKGIIPFTSDEVITLVAVQWEESIHATTVAG